MTAAPLISDPWFRRAVELIDAGDAIGLAALVEEHPDLLSATAEEDGAFAGDYFKSPKLLWFVAENPIRNGVLPKNIAAVTQVLLDAAKAHRVEDLQQQMDYTVALVSSGSVPRECEVRDDLLRTLFAAGADPTSGMTAALAHGEREALASLLTHGAEVTLSVAAAMGREDDLNRLYPGASDSEKHQALSVAAIHAQPRMARIMLDRLRLEGAEVNRFNPDGFHAHATPLHSAVATGCASTVCTFLTRGADPTIPDKTFEGTARGWAEHLGHAAIVELIDEAAVFVPAIHLVRLGDVEGLRAWLAEHPDGVNAQLGDNPRTLLHYATDWPGHLPRVGATIQALLEAGADPNVRYRGPDTAATETPLHWAASSDDLAAMEALLSGGAALDPIGGCIEDATPLFLAVLFKKWRCAERLLEAGAAFDLPISAALGRLDLCREFFDADGCFRNPYADMPYRDSSSDAARELRSGLFFALHGADSSRGCLEVVRFLVERGAEVNAIGRLGTSPLDDAIAAAERHASVQAVVDYLRSVGGNAASDIV